MLQLRHVTCNMVRSHLVFALVAPNLKGMKYSKGIQLKNTNSELNPYEIMRRRLCSVEMIRKRFVPPKARKLPRRGWLDSLFSIEVGGLFPFHSLTPAFSPMGFTHAARMSEEVGQWWG